MVVDVKLFILSLRWLEPGSSVFPVGKDNVESGNMLCSQRRQITEYSCFDFRMGLLSSSKAPVIENVC
jgi:hypothetical protein